MHQIGGYVKGQLLKRPVGELPLFRRGHCLHAVQVGQHTGELIQAKSESETETSFMSFFGAPSRLPMAASPLDSLPARKNWASPLIESWRN